MERGNIPRRRNLWHRSNWEERFPEGRREKERRVDGTKRKARTQCQHAERRVAFIYPPVISVICVYFVTNVNTVGPISVGATIKDTQIFSNKFRVHVDRSMFRMFEPNEITVDKQRKTEGGVARDDGGWVKRGGTVEKRGA